MFNHILIAVDGSDTSHKALETGCTLAKSLGADVHLVHSPQLETTSIAMGSAVVTIPVTPDAIAAAGKEVMEAASNRAGELGLTAQTTIGTGDATDDILNTAKLNDVDLIVMGRRGLGSVASLFLGSVSQKVGHGATCSVLTVAG